MKAAVLSSHDSPPAVGEFRDPEGEGHVLDVLVAGMNPVDITIASGAFAGREPELPMVAGLEGVAERGGGRVYFDEPVAPFGSMAERVLVDPDSLIEIPDGLDEGLAVSFGIAGLAAWLALEWRAKLQEGEAVLVLGCSSIVGQIGVQAAKLLGAGRVVGAARSDWGLERAKELGADATLQLSDDPGDDLADRLRDVGNGGFEVVIDPIWGPSAIASLGAMSREGRLIQIGNAAAAKTEVVAREIRTPLASIIGHTNFAAPQEVKRDAFERMCRHALARALRVDVEETSLDRVEDAWAAQKDGPHHKIVIRP
jgi:NADPH:quinone reductase-like Zn-dependent oxidoreductase